MSGTSSPTAIRKRGVSDSRTILGQTISGYCNVNGSGTITECKEAN
jgi:hypothetical protein